MEIEENKKIKMPYLLALCMYFMYIFIYKK